MWTAHQWVNLPRMIPPFHTTDPDLSVPIVKQHSQHPTRVVHIAHNWRWTADGQAGAYENV